MPKIRLLGNSVLSFVVKLVSGYWNLVDPTNGYIAVSAGTIGQIDLAQVARGYFFETDMLIKLNIVNAVIAEVPIPARYGDEPSSLSVARLAVTFPVRLLSGFMKRILFKYYIYDFNMASVYLLIGVPLFVFGVAFGIRAMDRFIPDTGSPIAGDYHARGAADYRLVRDAPPGDQHRYKLGPEKITGTRFARI